MKKLLSLWALLTIMCMGTFAQTWTWTGENPTAGGDFYIYHPNSQIFLNHQNKTGNNLSAGNIDNAFLWTITYQSVSNNVYTVNMKSGSYWFNLAKSNNNANPNLSNSSETIQLSVSTTNTSVNAYRIYRTASPTRYLSYASSSFSGASSTSNNTDWCFISQAQKTAYNNYVAAYNKAVAYGVSSDILTANNTANSSNVASKIEALDNAVAAKLASANLNSPLNLTSLIVNPDYEASTWNEGWTAEGFVEHANEGKLGGEHIAQMWSPDAVSGKISQTLTNLPAGFYKLSATCTGGFDGTTSIYAGSSKVEIPGINDDPAQNPTLMFHMAEAGDIEIGFERENCRWWTAVDDWTLLYCGNPAVPENCVETFHKSGVMVYTTASDGTQKAIGAGANWGTQAIPTKENELTATVSVNGEIAQIQFGDEYLFDANNYNIYTNNKDGGVSTYFFMQEVTGGYKFILAIDPNWAIGLGKDAKAQDYVDPNYNEENQYDVLKLVNVNDAPVWNFADDKATLSVKAGKYGTFVAPYNVTLPSTVVAYSAESNGTSVSLTELVSAGGNLTAGNPVIINTTDGEAVSQTYYGNASTSSVSGNGLVGFYESDIEIPKGSYVLQTQDGKQSFYKVTSDFTGTAYRCYLPGAAGAAPRLSIVFGEATDINNVEFNVINNNTAIYNLNGQRVNANTKGIVIVNGKKVVLR